MQQNKGTNDCYMEQFGLISRELYFVKKASPKRLPPVCFHLYDNLEITNYRNGEPISGCWK